MASDLSIPSHGPYFTMVGDRALGPWSSYRYVLEAGAREHARLPEAERIREEPVFLDPVSLDRLDGPRGGALAYVPERRTGKTDYEHGVQFVRDDLAIRDLEAFDTHRDPQSLDVAIRKARLEQGIRPASLLVTKDDLLRAVGEAGPGRPSTVSRAVREFSGAILQPDWKRAESGNMVEMRTFSRGTAAIEILARDFGPGRYRKLEFDGFAVTALAGASRDQPAAKALFDEAVSLSERRQAERTMRPASKTAGASR